MYSLIKDKKFLNFSGAQIRNKSPKTFVNNSVAYSTASYNDFNLLNQTVDDSSLQNNN